MRCMCSSVYTHACNICSSSPVLHPQDPVVLPDSGVTVDRATITRHLGSTGQGTDPFSRNPLTLEDVKPDAELAAKIKAWRAQHPEASM